MISIIVARTKDGVIGNTGGIPWYLPADLAHFKNTTMGHPVIMGRVTHESIGKALPGRKNIVITRQTDFTANGCETVGSLEDALNLVDTESEIFIIGGQEIYEQALNMTDMIYLTEIDANINGDKFFKFKSSDWQEISRESHRKDKNNPYDYSFIILKRNR